MNTSFRISCVNPLGSRVWSKHEGVSGCIGVITRTCLQFSSTSAKMTEGEVCGSGSLFSVCHSWDEAELSAPLQKFPNCLTGPASVLVTVTIRARESVHTSSLFPLVPVSWRVCKLGLFSHRGKSQKITWQCKNDRLSSGPFRFHRMWTADLRAGPTIMG